MVEERGEIIFVAESRYGGIHAMAFRAVEKPKTWKIVEKVGNILGYGVYKRLVKKEDSGTFVTKDLDELFDFCEKRMESVVETKRDALERAKHQLELVKKTRRESENAGFELGETPESDVTGRVEEHFR